MHVCANINNFIILIQLKFGPDQLPSHIDYSISFSLTLKYNCFSLILHEAPHSIITPSQRSVTAHSLHFLLFHRLS